MWFRNDLRIEDNLALCRAMEGGRCKAVYIDSTQQWRMHDESAVKRAFINRHLQTLSDQLAVLGVRLEVIEGSSFNAEVDIILQYYRQHNIETIFANSEPEINEIRRDNLLLSHGVNVQFIETDVAITKGSVVAGHGGMFKVFTPFKIAWVKLAKQSSFVPYQAPTSLGAIEPLPLPEKTVSERISTMLDAWPLVSQVREKGLDKFFDYQHDNYHQQRDFPALNATSKLSPYLVIGAISVKEIINYLLYRNPFIFEDIKSPQFAWLNELIWRDFYRHLQFHFPQLAMGKCFQQRYENMTWRNDEHQFTAWCEGRTGYPIVDAAMKQLLSTGWMHNRLRMIVASFLTKHLLIDWRWGEQFFMQHLIDGDLSANNGGWQWAASTGCDAQPYFRIFNPIRQSERFDPNGDFIRIYLPELINVPDKQIHFPHDYLKKNDLSATYYPPIVEHKAAREKALSFYKKYA